MLSQNTGKYFKMQSITTFFIEDTGVNEQNVPFDCLRYDVPFHLLSARGP